MAGQEEVTGVAVELRPLVRRQRVFDRELVQAELIVELVEVFLRGGTEVHPHHRVGLLEVLGDVGDREIVGLEHTVAVHPGHGHRPRYSAIPTAVNSERETPFFMARMNLTAN